MSAISFCIALLISTALKRLANSPKGYGSAPTERLALAGLRPKLRPGLKRDSLNVALPSGAGLRLQPEAQGLQPCLKDVRVLGGERWEVLNARRERISRAIQGTLLWSCSGSSGSRSRRRRVRTLRAATRSRVIRSVPARVSPWPLADDAPRCAHALCGVRTLGPAPVERQGLLSTFRRRGRELWITGAAPGRLNRGSSPRAPVVPASAGRRP